jgi:hypothetical protein
VKFEGVVKVTYCHGFKNEREHGVLERLKERVSHASLNRVMGNVIFGGWVSSWIPTAITERFNPTHSTCPNCAIAQATEYAINRGKEITSDQIDTALAIGREGNVGAIYDYFLEGTVVEKIDLRR